MEIGIKKYSRAEKEYLRVLKRNPLQPYALYNLGALYREIGANRKAYICHKRFISMYASIEDTLNTMDNDIIQKEDYEKAIKLYICPEDRPTMLSCAANTLDLFNDPRAQRYLEKAVDLDPNCETARINLGIFYVNKGLFEDALIQYQKAYELNKNDSGTILDLSYCLSHLNMDKESVEVIEEHLKTHPPTIELLINLSFGYLDLNRIDDSIAGFREYATMAPKSAEAHAGLAVVYAHKGWKNEAYKEIEEARQLNTRDKDEMVNNLIQEALEIMEDTDNDTARLLLLLLLLAKIKARRRMQKA